MKHTKARGNSESPYRVPSKKHTLLNGPLEYPQTSGSILNPTYTLGSKDKSSIISCYCLSGFNVLHIYQYLLPWGRSLSRIIPFPHKLGLPLRKDIVQLTVLILPFIKVNCNYVIYKLTVTWQAPIYICFLFNSA